MLFSLMGHARRLVNRPRHGDFIYLTIGQDEHLVIGPDEYLVI